MKQFKNQPMNLELMVNVLEAEFFRTRNISASVLWRMSNALTNSALVQYPRTTDVKSQGYDI